MNRRSSAERPNRGGQAREQPSHALVPRGRAMSAESGSFRFSADLELVVDGRHFAIPPTRPFVVGRGPDVDLDLPHVKVSRRHLVLTPGPSGWNLQDCSSNGTFLGDRRVTGLLLSRPVMLRLGGVNDGVVVHLMPALHDRATDRHGQHDRPSEADRHSERDQQGLSDRQSLGARQGQLSSVHQLARARLSIGRLPDNDVVIDDLLVSRRHAVLQQRGSQWSLEDLGSGNGTFVNGHRITRAPVSTADVIGIGRALLQLDGNKLVTYVDVGDNTFAADALTVTTKGKTLLHSISFDLPARTLLAVIGPSGAGKSTLLNALIGARPADSGTVRYAGRDLYRDYDELRHRIAIVPQDDVLHTQLTVRQALSFAARLRFPADTSADDRMRRVDEVLAELGLTNQSAQLISSLSGGQRKRTSVALELLTKPSLLFLDEPTSGLDPGMDRSVMHTLRTLADDSRTVVVVTHNVANLVVCDRLLLLAPGGWIAYFGPPSGALTYFDRADYAEIFLLLETAPGEVWARRFAESTVGRQAIGGPQPPPAAPSGAERGAAPMPRQQRSLIQFWVLCRRYLAVIGSDRPYAIFLIVLPLVLSLLARAVPGSAGLSVSVAATTDDPQPQQLLLVLIIGACLMGSAAAVRELVKERAIYRRERAIGLTIGAYVASKVVVLTVITGLQAVLFTVLGLLGRNPPDDPVIMTSGVMEILLAVLCVTVTSMLVGLVISASIDNADRGMPLLVLVIMIQLIFCGGLFAVYDRPVLEQLSWFVPARWGFSMTAATTDLSAITRGVPDPSWAHTATTWLVNAGLLLVIAAVLIALLMHLLRRLDPRRRARES